MPSVDECYVNISNYNDMKIKINSIINNLSNYLDSNDKLLLKINQNYLINNNDVSIYKTAKALSIEASKTSNYLKNTILPAIDNAISGENNKIYSIQEEQKRIKELEEASRIEEERKKTQETVVKETEKQQIQTKIERVGKPKLHDNDISLMF